MDGPEAADLADSASFRAPESMRRRPRRLADDVRDEILGDFIRSGRTAAGSRLPSEAELSSHYGVSRVTLRAAMRSLQEAGFVSIRQGVGTVVLPSSDSLTSGLDALTSFESVAHEIGVEVGTEELVIEPRAATPEIAAKLEIEFGTPGTAIERVKTVASARVAYMVDFVPAEVLAAETLAEEFAGSTLDVLLGHHDIAYADCDVAPVALEAAMARILRVDAGTPALFMDEVNRGPNGRPVFWGESWMLPEHLRFSLRRRKLFRR